MACDPCILYQQFQPTPEEVEAIFKLETFINKFLDDDFYDIEDPIDEEEESAVTESIPVNHKPSWLYRTTIPWQNTRKHVGKFNPSSDNDICKFRTK